MEISPDSTSNDQPAGCFSRFVGLFSALYLYFMVTYLVLRLFLGDQFWWLGLLNAFVIYLFVPLLLLLPLMFLLRRWRMMIRLVVLTLLAVIWFGPMFQPQHTTATGAPTLTIATYNMQGNYSRFVDHVDVIETWLDENAVDIVFLQETPAELADGVDTLREMYPEQMIQSDTFLTRSILSRFPLNDITTGDHFVRAVIDLDSTETAIYNVHFPWPFRGESRTDVSGMFDFITRYDESRRNEQIDAFLAQLAEDDLPHIVGGDFNMSQHSIIYSSLAVALDDSFSKANHGVGATWPQDGDRWITPVPLLRLDYVWYSEPYAALSAEVGPDFGSDHLPYVTTLELRSAATNE